MRRLWMIPLLLAAVSAAADEPAPHPAHRWLLGLEARAHRLADDDAPGVAGYDREGEGGGLQVGRMLTPHLLLRLHVGGGEHPTPVDDVTVTYAGGTLDLCYLFRRDRALRPYLFGGLGGYVLEAVEGNLRLDTSGPAMVFGGGAFLRLGGRFSLHAQARLEAVNWRMTVVTWDRPDGGSSTTETWVEDSGVAGALSLGLALWL